METIWAVTFYLNICACGQLLLFFLRPGFFSGASRPNSMSCLLSILLATVLILASHSPRQFPVLGQKVGIENNHWLGATSVWCACRPGKLWLKTFNCNCNRSCICNFARQFSCFRNLKFQLPEDHAQSALAVQLLLSRSFLGWLTISEATRPRSIPSRSIAWCCTGLLILAIHSAAARESKLQLSQC